MVKKLRVSLALQPLARRCSPTRPSPTASRTASSAIVRNLARHRQQTAPACCLRLRGRHGLRALCRLRARRAMYFIKRGDSYLDVTGSSFRDLLAAAPGAARREAIISDWAKPCLHDLPEVRLKRYLEMRGAMRAGAVPRSAAAFWVGLPRLQPGARRRPTWDLVKGLERRGAAAIARRRSPSRPRRIDRRPEPARRGARGARHRPGRPRAPGAARPPAGTRRAISTRSTASWPQAARRQRICSLDITGPGAAR